MLKNDQKCLSICSPGINGRAFNITDYNTVKIFSKFNSEYYLNFFLLKIWT